MLSVGSGFSSSHPLPAADQTTKGIGPFERHRVSSNPVGLPDSVSGGGAEPIGTGSAARVAEVFFSSLQPQPQRMEGRGSASDLGPKLGDELSPPGGMSSAAEETGFEMVLEDFNSHITTGVSSVDRLVSRVLIILNENLKNKYPEMFKRVKNKTLDVLCLNGKLILSLSGMSEEHDPYLKVAFLESIKEIEADKAAKGLIAEVSALNKINITGCGKSAGAASSEPQLESGIAADATGDFINALYETAKKFYKDIDLSENDKKILRAALIENHTYILKLLSTADSRKPIEDMLTHRYGLEATVDRVEAYVSEQKKDPLLPVLLNRANCAENDTWYLLVKEIINIRNQNVDATTLSFSMTTLRLGLIDDDKPDTYEKGRLRVPGGFVIERKPCERCALFVHPALKLIQETAEGSTTLRITPHRAYGEAVAPLFTGDGAAAEEPQEKVQEGGGASTDFTEKKEKKEKEKHFQDCLKLLVRKMHEEKDGELKSSHEDAVRDMIRGRGISEEKINVIFENLLKQYKREHTIERAKEAEKAAVKAKEAEKAAAVMQMASVLEFPKGLLPRDS